ncbi:amino acid adenylation domain-containing protein [Streptomyces sp. NPDC059513]|uniref:amino acid adenylation domain-containing protein n=1 Tax=unclassified Streptomyces TaxID=2593676 RepID=UPI0036AF5CC2
MTTARDLLSGLTADGVQLWVQDGRLRFRPSDALTPDRMGALRAHKAEIVGLLERPEADPEPAPLAVRPRPGTLPLSHGQESLWFLDRMGLQASYNVGTVVRIEGPLDTAALRGALDLIVRRHEVLRTRFRESEGTVAQVVVPDEGVRLVHTDLSGEPAERREAELTLRLERFFAAHFDLGQDQLLAVHLLRLDADSHVLALNAQHIVVDGASIGLLFAELKEAYAALRAGRAPELPGLAAQYADHALRQRERPGDAWAGHLAYWKQQLDGARGGLDLPLDRPRPATPDYAGASTAFTVPPALAAALQDLAARSSATPFMVLLAAFEVLMARWCRQDDVSVGTPVDTRVHPDTAAMIGYFANTVVIRADLSDNPAFTALLDRVRTTVIGAYEHRELPFDQVVAGLGPGRDQPLFDVMFSHLGAQESVLDGLTVTPVEQPSTTAKFGLSLFVGESAGGVHGSFEYATALFDEETVQELSRLYVTLLEGLVADPGARVLDLPLIDPADRPELLAAGAGGVPRGESLAGWFAERAAAVPRALALVDGESAWTYRELRERTDGLARALVAEGVGPERTAAVLLPRSGLAVTAFLAVLAAGGTHLPAEPALPDGALRALLGEARPHLVVTDEAGARRLTGTGHRLLVVDAPLTGCADRDGEGPPATVTGATAACVFPGSDATGRPTGLTVPHSALVNMAEWHLTTLPSGPGRVIAQFTSAGSEGFVRETLSALLSGATLTLVPDGVRSAPAHLAAWLGEHRVSDLYAPGTVLELLARAALADDRPLPALAHLVQTGENLELGPALKEFVAARPGRRLLHHHGGPGVQIATAHELPPGIDGWPETAPLGHPVRNTAAYVLDTALNLVPPGVAGELYVSGASLARGYHRRPALTAEHFVPDPYGPPGSRMYRTGDLVRRRADTTLTHLGRTDRRATVRGVRVEPAGTEAALLHHPAVAAAAVTTGPDGQGSQQLTAHLVPAPGAAPTAAGLRGWLLERLPGHAVPARYTALDALPLDRHGRTDLTALAAAGGSPLPGGDGPVAPRSGVEQLVAEVWQDVLGGGEVGVLDDFFAVGGHSLLVSQVLARVGARLGVEVPAGDFLAEPTVARLASLALAAGGVPDKVLPRAAGEVAQASFAQERMVFLHLLQPEGGLYNVQLPLALHGPLDRAALGAALDEIVRRHEVLRTVYDADGAAIVPVVLEPGGCPLEFADVTSAEDPEAALDALLREDAGVSFDIQTGPVIRVTAVRTAPDEHLLLLNAHHIAFDGYSTAVLVGELVPLYEAFLRGEPSPLPEPRLQYADFASWQRRKLQGAELHDHLYYWKRYLAGTPHALQLPTDRTRPAITDFAGDSVAFRVDAALTARLRALSGRSRVTLFMTTMAAYSVLLHRLSGQDDLCLGYFSGGRGDIGTDDLIGLFLNTLPVRSQTTPGQPFEAHLEQVRASVLGGDAHRELPFELLVDEVQPARDVSGHPVFQVAFSYYAASPEESGAGSTGVRITPSAVGTQARSAKFDLTLYVRETEDGELAGDLEFATSLFDRSTVERFAAYYLRLLEAVADAPETALESLPILDEGERRLLLEEWNDTAAEIPDATLPDLFEQVAARTPRAPAVVHGARTLPYGELDAEANRLARHLAARGIGPGDFVAVALPRTERIVVAVLAVLKAGAAYVPVDPAYPADRISLMLEDADPALVLTSAQARDRIPDGDRPLLVLDDPATAAAVAAHDAHAPTDPERTAPLHPSHPAYAIYTSGSTGRPKGVVVAHRSVANLAAWAGETFGGEPLSHVLAATSLNFDVSVFEMFGPLLTGGAVEIVSSLLDLADPAAGPYTASLLSGVPSALAQIEAGGGLRAEAGTVVLAGEPLSAKAANEIGRAVGAGLVANLYGPTESTVYATAWSSPDPIEGTPPIGRPIRNTRAYVLDAARQPVPVGVVGELHLAGEGLAHGYLNRPGLTADRFLPDPYGAPGTRMYRTGDLVRWTADGRLICLGRADDQVKVRGHRIELGEIEAHLAAHPDVEQAVAGVRAGPGGEQRIVAHVVGARPVTAEALREHLAGRLPGYMVPGAFVTLDALPLSVNGKVDRAALPDPDDGPDEGDFVSPATTVEKELAEIWADVLRRDRVGLLDNFFALGGHSLLVTQMSARIKQRLGVRISLLDIYTTQNLGELAHTIAQTNGISQ